MYINFECSNCHEELFVKSSDIATKCPLCSTGKLAFPKTPKWYPYNKIPKGSKVFVQDPIGCDLYNMYVMVIE